ncbi:TOBE domain-containing protein [Roseiarcaceae bacterium H3SJ34-1]|uniref:TOBE domain-containing protein n=1 Tax=Terripilifer ovatus TaxID=3032367 RepID=UPI003AB93C87|nr:TOBE domain-containing protein [Roseiarcaceae bacterium H3SJ34-1]
MASFIGGFSIVRGQVRDERFKIADSDAEAVRTPGARWRDGMLVIRPEDARPPDAYPDNRLQDKVLSSAFQGRCWRLAVDLGPQRVRLDWPEAPPVGASLAFALPPDRCVVLVT